MDPLVSLRNAYAAFLNTSRRQPLRRRWAALRCRRHVLAFAVKALVLRRIIRTSVSAWQRRATAAGLQRLMASAVVRRQISLHVLILFPTARSLTQAEWLDLLQRITAYFSQRVPILLRLLSSDRSADNDVIKLVKVAFGVVAGRCANRARHEPDEVDFIFNSIRLAYSWGSTYPLVDNVLDSKATSPRDRLELMEAVSRLIQPGVASPALHARTSELVAEVTQRLEEVLTLCAALPSAKLRHTLHLLLEAHARDATRRLSDLAAPVTAPLVNAVWRDSLLKAAFVRMATWQISGMTVGWDDWPRLLSSAMLNQFGDDLWDVLEDLEEDRVTPFTLHLTQAGPRDPFSAYIAHAVQMAMSETPKRRMALLFGLQETARCLADAIQSDPTQQGATAASRALTAALLQLGDSSDLKSVQSVPHVDLDAVVFNLARALMP